jgi:hypothetical protein
VSVCEHPVIQESERIAYPKPTSHYQSGQLPRSPFLANFGIADNSGVEQHNQHPLAVKRDAAQDPRRGIHQSGVSARRLGAKHRHDELRP